MHAIGLEVAILEHGIRMGLGSDAHVLLSEVLHLSVDRHSLLRQTIREVFLELEKTMNVHTYKLLLKRDLLELELVNCSLGRAQHHSCGQQSALHRARSRPVAD
jgi:hypothetical protein